MIREPTGWHLYGVRVPISCANVTRCWSRSVSKLIAVRHGIETGDRRSDYFTDTNIIISRNDYHNSAAVNLKI